MARIRFKTFILSVIVIIIGFNVYKVIRFYQQNNGPDYCTDRSTGQSLSRQEAVKIASQSSCLNEGKLSFFGKYCNDFTGTWWINMTAKNHPGCSPACVVNVITRQAEINWRCTGLNLSN